ncbi:MAG: hypothetical protein E6344_04445 [Clostridium sp.]|uniref:hypothetical protein n=1 Tax=Clostridium culturomicium TaxID=1499683 RepID=UPI00058B924A|nr:hypothetical protein [Clostridium culturomicium]MDU4889440.1 hypothetical protein [Clostridium sp.]MDU7082916.1 hypothetical protein [Clostridium sp.]
MKKYTKVLTLLLGVGIGIGASSFMGNTNNTQTAYANNGIGYTQLSGNYEEGPEDNDEYYYNEECYRDGGSRGCGRGSRESYRNQNYRNNMMNRNDGDL